MELIDTFYHVRRVQNDHTSISNHLAAVCRQSMGVFCLEIPNRAWNRHKLGSGIQSGPSDGAWSKEADLAQLSVESE